MDDGRQQPATNYRRTESIINVPVQRDNLGTKDPGIVSPEESFYREFPVFNGLPTLHSRPDDHELLRTVAFGMNEGFNLPKPELLTFDSNPLNYWRFVTNFETNIAKETRSARKRLVYLIQHCEGKAREAVEDCSMHP